VCELVRARKQEGNVGNRLNQVELWWCWVVRTRGIRGADWGGGGRDDGSGEVDDTDRLWGTQRGGGEVVNKVVHMWGHGGSDDGGGPGEWVKRL